MANHFVQCGFQVIGLFTILLLPLRFLSRRRKLLRDFAATGAAKCMTAADEKEVLGSVLLVDLILVRQVIADSRDMKIPRFDQNLDRFDHRWLKRLPFVFGIPWGFLLKIGGLLRKFCHGIRYGSVRY